MRREVGGKVIGLFGIAPNADLCAKIVPDGYLGVFLPRLHRSEIASKHY
jgi:hypothetical protein